jgi:cytochrome c biogenesis protein ResB
MLHAGIVLMLVGEFITGVWAIEGNMILDEGQGPSNAVIHNRYVELAVVDGSGKDEDVVTVVPSSLLKKGGTISNDELPFDIKVVKWMVNSELTKPKEDQDNLATKGFGLERIAVEQAEVSGVATKQTVDTPSAYLELTRKEDGANLGTYLVSLLLKEQKIEVDGKSYDVSLRFKHSYKPYSLELKEFRFDRYVGTSTPKNFSSRVRLRDPDNGEDREVTISMNAPLRHRGDAIFQADWNKETEKGTVLQVVRNPSWELPYWSCVLVALGMISHLVLNLVTFLQRRLGS